MVRFWSICRNTFVQTIRQPIFGILVLLTFGVLVLDVPLTGWTMGTDYHESDQKMLENLGLSTLLIAGLLVAAFSASAVLSREIEDRTALTVISKPVSRATFVAGKFAGVAGAVAVAFYLCGLVFLMTVRHKVMPSASDVYDWPVIVFGCSALALAILTAMAGNYLFGWTFTSATVWLALVLLSAAMGLVAFIGKGWQIVPFGQDIRPQLLVGAALTFMAVLIFVAVAVAASTRLGQVATLLVCVGVFFVGSIHPFLFGRWAAEVPAAGILGWVVPNLRYFDPQDPLTSEEAITLKYALLAAGYCLCYVAGVLAVGMGLFQRRELQAQASSASLPGLVNLMAWAGRAVALLAVIISASLLSVYLHPEKWDTRVNLFAAGLIVVAALTWILWGFFARGVRWSYWLVALPAAGVLARSAALLGWPDKFSALSFGDRAAHVTVEAAIAAVVLVILVLPRTRRHFKSLSP
ncbi:MAG: hypothetical protein SVT52_04070 [Planctomycetota bacterium]|nr:hypothetical protein [Planctomycetota bacterium]